MDDSTSHDSETSTDAADRCWLFSAYLKKAINGDLQKTLIIRKRRWCRRPRRDCCTYHKSYTKDCSLAADDEGGPLAEDADLAGK